MEFREDKLARIGGQSAVEERAARQALQRSAERPHRFCLSATVHMCMKQLWKAGERTAQRNRQNNPWSSHEAGENLYLLRSGRKDLIIHWELTESLDYFLNNGGKLSLSLYCTHPNVA